jgi:hypothetical protein
MDTPDPSWTKKASIDELYKESNSNDIVKSTQAKTELHERIQCKKEHK